MCSAPQGRAVLPLAGFAAAERSCSPCSCPHPQPHIYRQPQQHPCRQRQAPCHKLRFHFFPLPKSASNSVPKRRFLQFSQVIFLSTPFRTIERLKLLDSSSAHGRQSSICFFKAFPPLRVLQKYRFRKSKKEKLRCL